MKVSQEIDYKSLGPKKVLVAEDVELNQYLARHILESWDFEVVIVNNGVEALEALERSSFGLRSYGCADARDGWHRGHAADPVSCPTR